MDEATLAGIEQRAAAATEGPWFREYGDVITSANDPRDVADGYDEPRAMRVVRRAPHRDLRNGFAIADAEFIAHARTDVPLLLAEVRRLSAALADANKTIRALVAAEAALADLRAKVGALCDRAEQTNAAEQRYSGVGTLEVVWVRDLRAALAAAPSGEQR